MTMAILSWPSRAVMGVARMGVINCDTKHGVVA